MFERKEGKVYAADELAEASSAVLSARHAEMRDAGKEIGKLLSASNRVVKVCSPGPACLPACLLGIARALRWLASCAHR